jgi:hypothetical protein
VGILMPKTVLRGESFTGLRKTKIDSAGPQHNSRLRCSFEFQAIFFIFILVRGGRRFRHEV